MQLSHELRNRIKWILGKSVGFFHFMGNNPKKRLYYLCPPSKSAPYAYQHSSIRDVATTSDLCLLIKACSQHELNIPQQTLSLFQTVIEGTIQDYQDQYSNGDFRSGWDGNIGDIGFFLLLADNYSKLFPSKVNSSLKELCVFLIDFLLQNQRENGSFRIFLFSNYDSFEAEQFYLPEALIGLCSMLDSPLVSKKERIYHSISKASVYMTEEENRKKQLSSHTVTFYANWQLHFCHEWCSFLMRTGQKMEALSTFNHAEEILIQLQKLELANSPFGSNNAVVEIGCYLEGLSHYCHLTKLFMRNEHNNWLLFQIEKCLDFLERVRSEAPFCKGGLTDILGSSHGRVDVTGHYVNSLNQLLDL